MDLRAWVPGGQGSKVGMDGGEGCWQALWYRAHCLGCCGNVKSGLSAAQLLPRQEGGKGAWPGHVGDLVTGPA